MNTSPYRLLAPGPVPVPEAVLKIMSEKVLHHRTPAFERVLLSAWSGLQKIFATRQPVMILSGTGTAAMEAAVTNTLSPGDEALVVVSGKFGERWAEMCARAGVKTHRFDVAWGEALSIDEFKARLNAHPNLKAVFTQACETSTATVHPIQAMAAEVKKTGALMIVDAITAVGCMPLPMDDWSLDVVIAGSQKAFMIPTGLSFIALSEKAWRAQSESKLYKFYFDLADERKANEKKETHFSTPTPLIQGLQCVLEQMQKVGFNKVAERCEVLASATREGAGLLGLETYSKSPSSSVTAIKTPSGVDSAKLRGWLERERNITVMGGQDQLKGKIIRIGHMGDVRDDDMIAFFDAMAEGLDTLSGSDFKKKSPQVREHLQKRLKSTGPLFP
jgi:aspartate aminotransferase-like enzyme